MAKLPPHLKEFQLKIREIAHNYGLDPFDCYFEILEYDEINAVAAMGGFPERYPHWRFGMDFERLTKGYTYGLQKIYELVINTNPSVAYLLDVNSDMDHKLVISHVYGHTDFFKNNYWFSKTNRNMIEKMSNHANIVRKLIDQHGQEPIEEFIDVCLSLENLIDMHLPFITRRKLASEEEVVPVVVEDDQEVMRRSYMDNFIAKENKKHLKEKQQEEAQKTGSKREGLLDPPEKDILLFLIENAPLERWQRDILNIVRDEAYYFAPQGMTKIMNEGWAVFWHSKIMTSHILNDSEMIDYADTHSGTLATSPGQINPYKLGVELFKYIERKYDQGRFGYEYESCTDMFKRQNWDRKLGLGRQKIFEVRKHYNDVLFIDEFLDEEFAVEQKLYNYGFNRKTGQMEIIDRDYKKVKNNLLTALTNFGQPQIYVVDKNFENRGELLLNHKFDGAELDLNTAHETMKNLQFVWDRPVNLHTWVSGKEKLIRYDGKELTEKILSSPRVDEE